MMSSTDKRRRLSSRKFRPAVNLKRIRSPAPQHDLKAVLPEFESRIDALAEKSARIQSLRKLLSAKSPETEVVRAKLPVPEVEQLLTRLRRQRLGHLAPSFASPTFTRHYRRRFCGSVLALLDEVPPGLTRLYTIVLPTWRWRGDQLATVAPKKLLAQFRTQLNRAGLADFAGWLIASVHGEYDPSTDTFQLHLHVVVMGDKAKAVERLRDLALYKPQPEGPVRRPILRRRLKNPPWQVSYYLAQGFWPAKWRRGRKRRRIPEPRHAEMLMWLDRQKFSDLVWLHDCTLKNGRLVAKTAKRKAR